MADDQGTFVLRPGRLRVASATLVLVFCAGIFLFVAAMAAILAVIVVDGLLARFALWLLALPLIALGIYFLLLLRTNIIPRVEVGPQQLKLRLPRVRGPLPLLSTIRAELPYSAIASVETREEVYVSLGLVSVAHAYSIVTRDGSRILLGAVAENWGFQLPYDQVATRIAQRAGVPITDRGAVRAGGVLHTMLYDVPSWNTAPMAPLESKAWHRRAVVTGQILVLLVVVISVLRSCAHS